MASQAHLVFYVRLDGERNKAKKWTTLMKSPGVTPVNSWWGCAVRSPNPWPYFKRKNVIFHTRFQTWPLGRDYVINMASIRTQKSSSNAFRVRVFLFPSYSFGFETINTFIRSRSSLENHTRFQTKMAKVYTSFQTKKAQKSKPLGRHIPIWLI